MKLPKLLFKEKYMLDLQFKITSILTFKLLKKLKSEAK